MIVTKPDETPGLDELKTLTSRLVRLLKHPHPGLFSWRDALKKVLLEISEFTGEQEVMDAAKKVLDSKGYR